MNYPEQYRLLFLEGDQIKNLKLHNQTKIIDFVNTVHVPTPKFIISMPTSVNVTRGGSALIQVGVKSINPLTSIESIRPNVHLTFNKDRNYDNISLIFRPERANFSSENTAIL